MLENEEKEAIEKLRGDKYHIFIDREVKKLLVKGKYKMINNEYVIKDGKKVSDKIVLEDGTEIDACIGDDGFELLSKIRFKNLIEINLSCNGITSVKYLDNMILPHLEYLDLSNNYIKDTKPIAFLQSKHLKNILLQENEIETLKDFNHEIVKFENLEILRVDNNKLNIKDQEFKKAKEKFGNKLIYESLAHYLSYLNEKYDVNLSPNDSKIDLSDIKREELLIDLFTLNNYHFPIRCLYLDNNNFNDVSMLSNMPLYNLKILDLSLNIITSIHFLRKLSTICRNLKELYLNDNSIADITPIKDCINIDFSLNKLEVLTLKNNLFYIKENNNKDKIKEKNNKDNINDYRMIISIKDKEIREVFELIINSFNTDFGKRDNIIIKEDE